MKSPKYIHDRVKKILQLPALPQIASEIVESVDNPKTSASHLSKIISSDQGLTSKVLRIANSPFYGFPQKISTIDLAIIILGFDALKEIVISLSLISALDHQSDADFDAQQFWNHAITTAVIGRRLARHTGYHVTGEVFVGGLLHDIGISILHRFFKDEFRDIARTVRDSGRPALEVEKELLGATHADIGEWVSERWNLPSLLREGISKHHTPHEASVNPTLVALIHVSDVLSNAVLNTSFLPDRGVTFHQHALDHLNIDGDELMNEYMELSRRSGEGFLQNEIF